MTPSQRELLTLIRDGRDPTRNGRNTWPGKPGGMAVVASALGNRLIEGDYGAFRLTEKGRRAIEREEDGMLDFGG